MIANTTPKRPSDDSRAPTGSSRTPLELREVGTIGIAAAKASAASVTFTAKTDGHENHSSSAPESSRPKIAPAPAMPAQMPTARPRSSGGKTLVMIDSVVGITSAAPTPMTARSPISVDGSLTSIAAMDAPPKTTRPVRRTSLRPKRSPRAPAGSSSPAKTSA
jgi:hypothetical protein